MRVVAIAEHGDIDQVCRRRILPNLGINAREVDPFVEPAADPFRMSGPRFSGLGPGCPLIGANISAYAQRLDDEELADWRAGRNAVYQLAALTIGARLAVADA